MLIITQSFSGSLSDSSGIEWLVVYEETFISPLDSSDADIHPLNIHRPRWQVSEGNLSGEKYTVIIWVNISKW